MSFTRWRSLVDGTEVDVGPATPDTELLHSHWDARQLSGFSDGDEVSSFEDLEGDNDLSGSGIYREDGINGIPGIELDGTDDGYTTSDWDETIDFGGVSFVVFEFDNTDSDMQLHDAETDDGGTTWFLVSDPDDDQYRIFGGNPQSTLVAGSPDTQSNYMVVEWADDNDQQMRLNGSQIADGDGGDRQLTAGENFGLGRARDADERIVNGVICEAGVYEPGVSITELESYLSDRYGI